MLERWFLAHPRSMNESYLEHQACALKFSASLLAAAGACFVHALVPGLFERTGSAMIERLHGEMVTHRKRHEAAAPRAVAPATTLSRSDA
jgi:coenzyme F420-reducing hydrogenase gamma subunit